MQYREFVDAWVETLRARAGEREAEGATGTATLYARLAAEIAKSHHAFLHAELHTHAAAQYSGFSKSAIKLWKRQGKPCTRAHLPVRPMARKPALSPTATEAKASQRIRRKAS